MGQIGINPGLMESGMPIVGKGAPSRLILFHQGNLPGTLSLVMLLPDTMSARVILMNTLALNDVSDWIGQLILEGLLDVPQSERNDYISVSKASVSRNLMWYPNLVKQLRDGKKIGTSPNRLENYTGTSFDATRVFKIVVSLEDGALYRALQGLESKMCKLTHYDDDTFTWFQPRNELSWRGIWVGTDQGPLYWKVSFHIDSKGDADSFSWVHDEGVSAVEYRKQWSNSANRLPSNL